MRLTLCFALCLLAFLPGHAETRTFTGPEYVAGVKAAKPKGGVYIRARLVQGKTVMQIQIKRRSLPDGSSDQLFQVIFPKERKGESVLLHLSGGTLKGSVAAAGGAPRAIGNGDRRMTIFGTDLTVEDLLADFYDWKQQNIIGHESVGPAACAVIESKPDRPGKSPSKAVSWVDEKRYVPLRVHVFDGGDKPARIVDTEKVIQVSSGYYLPVIFTVTNTGTGSKTTVEGSSSKDGINYTDADFSEATMQQVTPPPSGS
ncbi:MAG: hypothetical protein JWO89_548 [Verrucomicrobiaceae bacterium]|nr:hypothetical protein [Verrucomicrobiaceae bacterium]